MAPRPGYRHPSAVIGSPPEHRGWTADQQTFEPEIAATAQVNAFVTIDAGIEQPTRLGDHVFAMAHVHIGHDAQIGEDCELAPGTVIGGYAVLEPGVHCGIGVLVLPRRRIGRRARIGAGAVVTKDVPADAVYVGNPAKQITRTTTRPITGEQLTPLEEQGWEELAAKSGVDPGWIEWWHDWHPVPNGPTKEDQC